MLNDLPEFPSAAVASSTGNNAVQWEIRQGGLDEYNCVSTIDYKQYQVFCENTPSVFSLKNDDSRMREISDLVSQVTSGKTPALDFPCLFLTYFANAYFGIAQYCQIDVICSVIE